MRPQNGGRYRHWELVVSFGLTVLSSCRFRAEMKMQFEINSKQGNALRGNFIALLTSSPLTRNFISNPFCFIATPPNV